MMTHCQRLLVFLSFAGIFSEAIAKDRAANFVSENPAEFFAKGDFNGDGRDDLVLAHKESGKYRIGYGQPDGTFQWVDCRASGLASATGFTVGRLLAADRDALAFTSPDANQIVFIDASSRSAPSKPKNVPFTALGPGLLVAADAGGSGNTPLDDLYVGSIYNSPDANLETLMRNDGAEFPRLGEAPLPGTPRRGNVVSLKIGGAPRLAVLIDDKKGGELRVEDFSAGKLATATATAATWTDYTVGNFSSRSLTDFILFTPGDKSICVHTIEEASVGRLQFQSGPGSTFDLAQPIREVVALNGRQLLVIFGNGESAGVFDFDGVKAPMLKQTLTSASGLVFAGALPLDDGVAMFARYPGTPYATRFDLYHAAGATFAAGAGGDLPSLADNDNITVPDIYSRIADAPQAGEASMKIYTNTIPGTRVSFVMVPVPGGEFLMGSPDSEPGRKPDEGPQHKVKLSPFWIEQCEVTWNEYELFMYPDQDKATRGTVPTDAAGDQLADAVTHPSRPYLEMSFGMGKDGCPAIAMTQHAANKYCQWLSAKTGQFYRLPTEAEWEYAARAGTTTAYFFGDDAGKLPEHGWFEDNSDFKYQKVGKKKPNAWGLYDVCGNVTEWVLDQYDPEFYKACAEKGVVVDPWNRATKGYPLGVRGGSWDDPASRCRSAARRGSDRSWKAQDPQLPKSVWFMSDGSFVGFRVVRPLKAPSAEEMQRYWNNGVYRE